MLSCARLRLSLTMLATVLLSACGTSGLLVKEQEVVIVEKIIKAATYHPETPPPIRPPPSSGPDFFKAVNVQVVGQSFLDKISEVYPADYFDQDDVMILLDAAVAWMGNPVPQAFFCLGDRQLHELEIWQEGVKLYVQGAARNFEYYQSLE